MNDSRMKPSSTNKLKKIESRKREAISDEIKAYYAQRKKIREENKRDNERRSRSEHRVSRYTEQFLSESAWKNLKIKELYKAGLLIGHMLRRTLYSEAIVGSLQEGKEVYLLARDMTWFYDFLKDMYPNVHIVYNVNRSNGWRYENIKAQIPETGECIIVDTGFSGSCIRPIKRWNPDIKGYLLTTSRGNEFEHFSIVERSQGLRSAIVDLEHSPKMESIDGEGTFVNLEDWKKHSKQFYAFRLGLFAGFMNLRKKTIADRLKAKVLIAEARTRRERNYCVNHYAEQGLARLNDFAKYGRVYSIDYGTIQGIPANGHYRLKNKQGQIRLWKKLENAKKALEISNRRSLIAKESYYQERFFKMIAVENKIKQLKREKRQASLNLMQMYFRLERDLNQAIYSLNELYGSKLDPAFFQTNEFQKSYQEYKAEKSKDFWTTKQPEITFDFEEYHAK